MEPRAHHLIIGLFTVLAVAAALAFALWLSKSTADRDWSYYEVAFKYGVSGLSKGSPVLFSGVEVGNVEKIYLYPEDPREVRVLVRIDSNVPIRENTRAGLALANITGSMRIEFSGGTPDSPVLEGDINDPPLIVAERSAFSSMLTDGENLLKKADDLLTNANALFSEQNTENLTKILDNTRVATDALIARREQLAELLVRLDAASRRAEEAAIKVSKFSDNADDLLQTEGRQLLADLGKAINSVQVTASRIDNLAKENEGAVDAGLQGMGELAPALRELRSILRNLNQFTRRLEDNPSGTLWGGETIQEIQQ